MRSSFYVICLFFIACTSSRNLVDHEKEKQALLDQHRRGIKAHFERDAAGLVYNNLDSFIYVGNGEIGYNQKEQSVKMFTEYLSGAEYLQYEDLDTPIIRISNDASMAWMITRTQVRRKKKYGNETREEGFVYSGIMTYRKINGVWMREANVSTFAPPRK